MPWGVAVAAIGAGVSYNNAENQEDAAYAASNKQAQGVSNALEATKQAQDRALPLIEQGYVDSRNAINQGATQAQQNLLSGQADSLKSLNSGYETGRADAITGFNNAGNTLDTYYNEATKQYEPMAQQGAGASQMQAALSGALGPEAEAQAIANFTESPGQKYLRDQQEQSILRNESALGGGVSANGRVLTALQEQAMGRASTNLDNRFNQAGVVANRGAAANDSIANLKLGLGASKAGIQQQLAQLLSGMSVNRGTGIAGVQANGATNMANLNTTTAGQLAQSLQGQGITQGNVLVNQGTQNAQLQQNLGQAQSGADIYNSQNMSPWLQGIQAGVGAYGATGGNFGNALSGIRTSSNPGATQSGYTGSAYDNWAAQQRGIG